MTLWQSGGLLLGHVVCAVAWFRGGRPERFGVGLFLLANLLARPANAWVVDGIYPAWVVLDGAILVVLCGLCFRSDRWWPLVAASAYGLMIFGQIIRLMDPTFSHYALVSSHIGLGYVVDLALLFGVWERWAAGEPPVGPAAWAKANRAAAARRGRPARPPGRPAGSCPP